MLCYTPILTFREWFLGLRAEFSLTKWENEDAKTTLNQEKLGEKLYVSDKTVSRWERDECTPELSLLPAIAEIFGITTDELPRRKDWAAADSAS